MSRPVDATAGPLFPAVVKLAAPVVLMSTAHTAFHLVNTIWVGRLGATATAALTTSFFVLWTLYALADIAAVGVTATVARHVGAREPARAGYAAAQGAVLAVVLGCALALIAALVLPPVFSRLGLAPDVRALALSYLAVAFAAAPLSFVYVTCEAVMRAAGDTRTPLLVIVVGLALNAALDPLLIFGIGPFPRLGVTGAAIATVIAQALAVAWFLVLAFRGHPAFPFDRRALTRPAPRFMAAMAAIGAPFASIGVFYSAVYLFFAAVAARFGTGSVAILGIGNRVESVAYLIAAGFGLAVETLVGQNLGARRPERAERAVWIATGLMVAFGAAFSLVMAAWPAALLSLFLRDGDVIAQGVPLRARPRVDADLHGARAGHERRLHRRRRHAAAHGHLAHGVAPARAAHVVVRGRAGRRAACRCVGDHAHQRRAREPARGVVRARQVEDEGARHCGARRGAGHGAGGRAAAAADERADGLAAPHHASRRPRVRASPRRPGTVTRSVRSPRARTEPRALDECAASAAPSAPPTCARRSVQSVHARRSGRRALASSATWTPSPANPRRPPAPSA